MVVIKGVINGKFHTLTSNSVEETEFILEQFAQADPKALVWLENIKGKVLRRFDGLATKAEQSDWYKTASLDQRVLKASNITLQL